MLKKLRVWDDKTGFADRDLVIVHIDPRNLDAFKFSPGIDPRFVHKTFERPEDRSNVISSARCDFNKNSISLIGKDGSLKKVWVESTPTRGEIFALIDAMPMRQNEMRLQRGGN